MTHIQAFEPRQWYDAIESELATGHWRETESHLIDTPPALNRSVYDVLYDAGMLIAIGAFDNDKIVGYATAFINPHTHYNLLYAVHDALYLSPAYRKGRTGLKLIRTVEEDAKQRGAAFIAWHAKPNSQFARILQRCGYETEEYIYQRRFK